MQGSESTDKPPDAPKSSVKAFSPLDSELEGGQVVKSEEWRSRRLVRLVSPNVLDLPPSVSLPFLCGLAEVP